MWLMQDVGCRVRGMLREMTAPPRGHEVGPAALLRGCDASVPQPLHPPHVGKHERGEEAPDWDEMIVRGRVGVGLNIQATERGPASLGRVREARVPLTFRPPASTGRWEVRHVKSHIGIAAMLK